MERCRGLAVALLVALLAPIGAAPEDLSLLQWSAEGIRQRAEPSLEQLGGADESSGSAGQALATPTSQLASSSDASVTPPPQAAVEDATQQVAATGPPAPLPQVRWATALGNAEAMGVPPTAQTADTEAQPDNNQEPASKSPDGEQASQGPSVDAQPSTAQAENQQPAPALHSLPSVRWAATTELAATAPKPALVLADVSGTPPARQQQAVSTDRWGTPLKQVKPPPLMALGQAPARPQEAAPARGQSKTSEHRALEEMDTLWQTRWGTPRPTGAARVAGTPSGEGEEAALLQVSGFRDLHNTKEEYELEKAGTGARLEKIQREVTYRRRRICCDQNSDKEEIAAMEASGMLDKKNNIKPSDGEKPMAESPSSDKDEAAGGAQVSGQPQGRKEETKDGE